MTRHLLSIAIAAAFVGMFAATSEPPRFFLAQADTQIVEVALDADGEASGEVRVVIDGLQHPIDSWDIELRIVVGSDDMPRWLRVVRDEDWQPRARHEPRIATDRLLCEPAPEPCELTAPFLLTGRRNRSLDVPFTAELGTLNWGDQPDSELEALLEGATVRLQVELD